MAKVYNYIGCRKKRRKTPKNAFYHQTTIVCML